MPVLMQNDLVLLLLKVYGVLFLLGPIILRATFRFKAKLDPQLVPLESLPPDVGQFLKPRVAAIAGLGFEPVGYINLGTMAGSTQSFMALLNNSKTLEWANVSVVKSTKQRDTPSLLRGARTMRRWIRIQMPLRLYCLPGLLIMSFGSRRSRTPSRSTALIGFWCSKTRAGRGRSCRQRARSWLS